MNTYDNIDIKLLEKSTDTVCNVRALIGCIIRAISDCTHDRVDSEEKVLLCDIKGSLEIAYKVTDEPVTILCEVAEIIERQSRS